MSVIILPAYLTTVLVSPASLMGAMEQRVKALTTHLKLKVTKEVKAEVLGL